MMNNELSVYVHFLYCKSRCPYCDFFKGILPKDFDEEAYIKKVIENLYYASKLSGKREVNSVFFGGGTPSLLSCNAVNQIIDEISKCYEIKKGAEITIEANPNSFEKEKFSGFKSSGVNRLSLGVQALNETDLKRLGRTHSLNEAREAIDFGAKVFDKFSVDLIYAREGQKFDDWEREVLEVIDRGAKHISLYQLTIEEGTVFYKKNVKEMDEDESAKLYEQTVELLRQKGFERYEVSNFAKRKSDESVHNLAYWEGKDYIGLGVGAVGRLKVKDDIYGLKDGVIEEKISNKDRALELLFMGFRIKKGIGFEEFYEASGVEFFDFVEKEKVLEFKKSGLLEFDEKRIWMTDDGFLVMNKIIYELL